MSDTPSSSPLQLVVVSGLSGAGKTIALHALEDTGYQIIDNAPLATLHPIITSLKGDISTLAVGVDIRSQGFSSSALRETIAQLEEDTDIHCQMLFLNCDTDKLVQRFKETRRPHPLAITRPTVDGIRAERDELKDTQRLATHVIDTTQLKPRDLQSRIETLFATCSHSLTVRLQSFSFKFGLPRDADLVFDVRFLRNPYYDEALRPLNGTNKAVQAHVMEDDGWEEFISRLTALLDHTLPRYRTEGKKELVVGIGCTGGQHRSVCVVEMLKKHIATLGYPVEMLHREITS